MKNDWLCLRLCERLRVCYRCKVFPVTCALAGPSATCLALAPNCSVESVSDALLGSVVMVTMRQVWCRRDTKRAIITTCVRARAHTYSHIQSSSSSSLTVELLSLNGVEPEQHWWEQASHNRQMQTFGNAAVALHTSTHTHTRSLPPLLFSYWLNSLPATMLRRD